MLARLMYCLNIWYLLSKYLYRLKQNKKIRRLYFVTYLSGMNDQSTYSFATLLSKHVPDFVFIIYLLGAPFIREQFSISFLLQEI